MTYRVPDDATAHELNAILEEQMALLRDGRVTAAQANAVSRQVRNRLAVLEAALRIARSAPNLR